MHGFSHHPEFCWLCKQRILFFRFDYITIFNILSWPKKHDSILGTNKIFLSHPQNLPNKVVNCVVLYTVFVKMPTVLLPPGFNPITANKYIRYRYQIPHIQTRSRAHGPPVQWVSQALSEKLKRMRLDANQSPPSNSKVELDSIYWIKICVLIFSTTFVWNNSHSNKNWAR